MFKKQLDSGSFNSILNYYFPLCHGLGAFDMEWWVEPKTVSLCCAIALPYARLGTIMIVNFWCKTLDLSLNNAL